MKQKALMILPYVPWPLRRGTYQRVYHLAREVADRYDMDLFCLSSEQENSEHLGLFQSFCKEVKFQPFQHGPWPSFLRDRIWHVTPVTVRHWWSDEAFQSLSAFTSGKTYDLIWFCDLVLFPYVKKLFPSHPNIVMDRSRVDWLFQTEELNTLKLNWMDRLMRAENLAKIARMEVDAWRHLALTVVCGPDDKDFLLAKSGPDERIFVLANGANTEFFSAADWPPQPTSYPSALFCGALDYTPNTDALEWYFDVIHEMILKSCPEYRILLVGKNPTKKVRKYAALPGVEFIGEVEDVRPYYQKAWLQIVPLRIGGGTRLKIAEGLAMANPVVSTTLGAQGLDLTKDEDILLADTPIAFRDAVLRYFEDPDLRKRHGESGCKTIDRLYTWSALGRKLAARLDETQPVVSK